jgi:hypothetical protein
MLAFEFHCYIYITLYYITLYYIVLYFIVSLKCHLALMALRTNVTQPYDQVKDGVYLCVMPPLWSSPPFWSVETQQSLAYSLLATMS